MPLRLPPLRLAFHKRHRTNIKLPLLRHDHKPHRLLQHFASIDLDGCRKSALRQRQRLFRRDHPARLAIERHRLVRLRGRVAFADARVEPPKTRMPPQLAVAVVAHRLVRHRNRKRDHARRHPLRRNRRRAAIHARRGIWRNHHTAPKRLHAVRGNVELDVHRLAVPIHALGIEAGDSSPLYAPTTLLLPACCLGSLRRARRARPTIVPHKIRELHLHAFHRATGRPQGNLPHVVFVLQRHARKRIARLRALRPLCGKPRRRMDWICTVFGEHHRVLRMRLPNGFCLCRRGAKSHRRPRLKRRSALKPQNFSLTGRTGILPVHWDNGRLARWKHWDNGHLAR